MNYGAIAIVVICVFIIFIVRAALGIICIYFGNQFLETQGISIAVGINPISLLTAGSLGISGVALLYGIVIYKSL